MFGVLLLWGFVLALALGIAKKKEKKKKEAEEGFLFIIYIAGILT
jgi:prolipoprotein diacylglyceryltransferase